MWKEAAEVIYKIYKRGELGARGYLIAQNRINETLGVTNLPYRAPNQINYRFWQI